MIKLVRVGSALFFLATFSVYAQESSGVFPNSEWVELTPAEVELDRELLEQARDYALTGGGSGIITRFGRSVMSWGDQHQRYDIKSATKSVGVTALGLALQDKKIGLDDLAITHHSEIAVPPESNRKNGWNKQITIRHLATHTAGFEKSGGYVKLLFPPGTQWHYSDSGANYLAECITLRYRRDLKDLMFERIFQPIGITETDLKWRNNSFRDREIGEGVPNREMGSGITASVDALARIGTLYLRQGQWKSEQLIPAEFVREATRPLESNAGTPIHELSRIHWSSASDYYGLLWWSNATGTFPNVPRDAFWAWGAREGIIFVVPSLDIVAARAGDPWKRPKTRSHEQILEPFYGPICAAVLDAIELTAEENGKSEPIHP